MKRPHEPVQQSDSVTAAPPSAWSWGEYLSSLVEAHGTLTAVAWKLLEREEGPEDVASVERALRRLRSRGQRDGGSWGARLLRLFGVPAPVAARVRWMGLYHSPFHDLPVPLCRDQLRLWDRPPVAESRARVWLHLGFASCALRSRAFPEAAACLARARAVSSGQPAAQIELALAEGYLASRVDEARVSDLLAEAASLLTSADLSLEDAACFRARLVDQLAFGENRRHAPEGDARALALYQGLPSDDVHPFASYRRDAGLAYGLLRAGRRAEALVHARRACRHAGDGGYVRLRVMGLLMQAKILGPADAGEVLCRARNIALRLEDAELLSRIERTAASG